ncbi:MAG TPA: ABC transporter ATP-binding protein [Alphaproteobacteria bacterium]|nr:ABC transporter ATP-binding protein [Alphaproteobacteria bacterium]
MLRLENVHSFYGRIQALRGINLHVDSGEIVAMIGANGAGKSTTLMTICGQPRAKSGRVLFDGDDITHVPTFQIIRSGLSHSPEGRRIFPRMTVLENLQMGAVASDPAHFNDDLGLVFDLFPILGERQQQRGGTLSGGEQQMLAIARALMSHPRLLLLDEPSLGLGPMLVKQIFDVIGQINQDRGVTILLVEQNAHQSLHLAHRAYVLANGEIILHGTGDELLADPEVRNAYLEGGN